jgi:hypothetical protein
VAHHAGHPRKIPNAAGCLAEGAGIRADRVKKKERMFFFETKNQKTFIH